MSKHPGTTKVWLPGIEALRGVAALTVVFHHMWSLSSMPRFTGYRFIEGFGTWGVNLFFMLSGFLLAETFWRERGWRVGDYAIRRFFRIAPAYYVNIGLLFLFFAGPALIFSAQGKTQLLASGTFTHYLFPETASSLNVNGALWTLTIEMMLYAFLPFMALAIRMAPWPAFLALVAIGLSWRTLVALDGNGLRGWYFGDALVDPGIQSLFLARQFIGAVPVFAVGVMLRWLIVTGKFSALYAWLPRRLGVSVVLVLTVPSVALLHWVEEASSYQNALLFVGFELAAMVLLVPALVVAARPHELPPNPLSRVSTWLGERSYSIYLWHFPIILAVYERGPLTALPAAGGYAWRLPAIVVLTLVFAAVSYSTIERPGMEWGRRLAGRVRARRPEQGEVTV